MDAICSTMVGKMPDVCMEVVNAEPLETSRWICSVASWNTALPDAPPTESRASTRGTPAANMVDKVRVQRATADLYSRSPNTGIFSQTDGALLVDYATDPPTFSGGMGTSWEAEHCYQCPKHPVQCGTISVGGGWGAEGEVEDKGTRIAGIILDDVTLDPVLIFNFVKGTPPPPRP